jgi:hypothetical protein
MLAILACRFGILVSHGNVRHGPDIEFKPLFSKDLRFDPCLCTLHETRTIDLP